MTTAPDLYLQLGEPACETAPPGRTDETRSPETADRDAVLAGQLLTLVLAAESR